MPPPSSPHNQSVSNSAQANRNNKNLVPQWVAQQFYRHGLFCSSQPLAVLVFAFIGILWACYPLLTIQVYSGDAKVWIHGDDAEAGQDKPRWAEKPPVGYVQQIIMKAAVHPYNDQMIRSDAFRGPLATAFKLHLSDISEYFDRTRSGLDMDHECLRTDGLAPRYRSTLSNILPDYGCLILSPANIWRKDSSLFQSDGNIVDTVFQLQRSREGHSSLADIMFGLRQRDTGMTKYPVNNRQRTLTYSVTVVLRQHKPQFITSLKSHLYQVYPLHTDHDNVTTNTVHLHFPEMFSGAEHIPYTITLICLFLYVYYSFNKIDLVNSKFGIALTAVITILGSLFMSLGLTGLSLGGTGYVYLVPYLVAALGLENILVVTRSIVSTPAHLDIKVRIAQGLSREGWNITKNLFSEITVLTLGFFLGILDSSIQDFCLLAVMGLLTDFYLQTFFFLTVLSMDINRTKLVDLVQKQNLKTFQHPVSGPGMKISTMREGEWLVAPPITPPAQHKPSKRLRIFNFWAQKRVVSRLFIVVMIGWIGVVIYQTGIIDTVVRMVSHTDKHGSGVDVSGISSVTTGGSLLSAMHGRISAENISNIFSAHPGDSVKSLTKLQHKDPDYWRRLPYSHWPMLFGLYNISVYGNHLVLLPPILLSTVVSPEAVVKLRSPNEKPSEGVDNYPAWTIDKIKSALDIGDEDDGDNDYYDGLMGSDGPELSPFVPTSPGELVLAFALAVPSILFLIYLSIVCYRFICSKNYAKWRSRDERAREEFYTEIVQEGAPQCLDGHNNTIETLITDGHLILSQCLAGRILVWDSLTGEVVTRINRHINKIRNKPTSNSSSMSFLPKKETYEGSALRKYLRQRKTKSDAFLRFSDTFSDEIGSEEPIEQLEESTTDDNQSECCNGNVWCVDMADSLVVLGCDNGRVEVWDCMTGQLKCNHEDGRNNGASHVKILPGRVCVARLDGHLDFLDIVSIPSLAEISPTKSRMRLVSTSSNESLTCYSDTIKLVWSSGCRAHLQSINCLNVQDRRLITGSSDHTLRVFRSDDGVGVYTLHGHTGPITAIFIDRHCPVTAGSASQDGMLCVWDLLTGACMYSIQAHNGPITDMTYSPGCVVTMGDDDKLCVWERHQGHLLNCVDTSGDMLTGGLVMLTHNMVVTASGSNLVVWDVRLSLPVKIVRLGQHAGPISIIRQAGDTIITANNNRIKLVKFPILTHKID